MFELWLSHTARTGTGTGTKWKVPYAVEMFTLVGDRNRDQDPLFPIVPVPFSVPPTVLFPYNVNKPLGRVWLPTIRNKVAETEEISSRRFVPVSFRTMEDRF